MTGVHVYVTAPHETPGDFFIIILFALITALKFNRLKLFPSFNITKVSKTLIGLV